MRERCRSSFESDVYMKTYLASANTRMNAPGVIWAAATIAIAIAASQASAHMRTNASASATSPPAPPPEPSYRCDATGGERGVCVIDHQTGNYTTPTCDGKCGGGAATFKCSTDWDCSFAGVCDTPRGTCTCDAWATGSDCSYLNFKPVDPAQMGYVDPHQSSWGGNALLGSDKKWHLFMAEIACPINSPKTRCGLGGWQSNSQVAHAVSDSPAGPYTHINLVLPREHHNPTIKVSPVDGSWNIYSISAGSGPIVTSTSVDEGKSWSGVTPGIVVSTEQNPGQSITNCKSQCRNFWIRDAFCSQHQSCRGSQPKSSIPVKKFTIPIFEFNLYDSFSSTGPVLFKNGTMNMFYRAQSDLPPPTCSTESIGVQYCANRTAPCSGGFNPIFKHTAEDPSVFIDHRGNWHMLVNALPGGCNPKVQQGGHAWSKDGVVWSEPRTGAYNTTIVFTNGTSFTCSRRERPQMILDGDGVPLAMTSGVTGCPPFGVYKGGGDCFTLAQLMQQ